MARMTEIDIPVTMIYQTDWFLLINTLIVDVIKR